MTHLVRYVLEELAAHPDRLLALGSMALIVGFATHTLMAPAVAPAPAPTVTRTAGVEGPRSVIRPGSHERPVAPRVRPQVPASPEPTRTRTRTTSPAPPATQTAPRTPSAPPTSEEPTHVPSTSVPPLPEPSPSPTGPAPAPDPS